MKVDYFQNPGSTDNTTKCERNLLQNASGFLLQNATVLLENATIITHYDDFITKCDSYYKTRRLLQTATAHPWKFHFDCPKSLCAHIIITSKFSTYYYWTDLGANWDCLFLFCGFAVICKKLDV